MSSKIGPARAILVHRGLNCDALATKHFKKTHLTQKIFVHRNDHIFVRPIVIFSFSLTHKLLIKGEQKKMSLFEISILSDLLNQIFPAFSPYFITMICIIKFRLLFDPWFFENAIKFEQFFLKKMFCHLDSAQGKKYVVFFIR